MFMAENLFVSLVQIPDWGFIQGEFVLIGTVIVVVRWERSLALFTKGYYYVVVFYYLSNWISIITTSICCATGL